MAEKKGGSQRVVIAALLINLLIAVFKFVACEPSDLDEVAVIIEECGLTDVWIMPEGTDAATLLGRSTELADDVVKRGWNLSSRLHILLWGDVRGR